MLEDKLDDWCHGTQQEDHSAETGKRHFLAFGRLYGIEHRSESSHVQRVQLVDKAGELGLVVRRNSSNYSAQIPRPNMGHLNRAGDGIALAQRKFQVQYLPRTEDALNAELKTLLA